MPSTSTERSRRLRAHRRGDHSLCTEGRCKALWGGDLPGDTPAGSLADAIRALTAAYGYGEGDPRHGMLLLAQQYAARLDAEPGNVPTGRELRLLLQQVAEFPHGEADWLDELRLKRAQRIAQEHYDMNMAAGGRYRRG